MHNNLQDSTAINNSWFLIWKKDWSIYNWLMTSVISSVIIGEVYTVALSMYPNLLLSLWLSMGINSIALCTMLTALSIITIGLVLGALFYSAHLTYQSILTLEQHYQPLIAIWSSNHELCAFILKNLLTDENFLKITNIIKSDIFAPHLKDYLQSSTNFDAIRELITILQKIWSQDNLTDSAKMLVLSMLAKYIKADSQAQHINNIFNLMSLLITNQDFNFENIIRALESSPEIASVIRDMQNVATEEDIMNVINSNNIRARQLECINPAVAAIISASHRNPETLTTITEKISEHHNQAWLEELLIYLNTPKYSSLLTNLDNLVAVISVYSDRKLPNDFPVAETAELLVKFAGQANLEAKLAENMQLKEPTPLIPTEVKKPRNPVHKVLKVLGLKNNGMFAKKAQNDNNCCISHSI